LSIRTFNKIMQSKGCIPLMSAVLLVTMIMSFGARGCSGKGGQNPNEPVGANIVASVGDYQIDARKLEQAYEADLGRSAGAPPDAMAEAKTYGSLLGQEVRMGLTLIEAKRKQVSISDAVIKKRVDDEVDQGLMQARFQVMQEKKLKSFPTDKEMDDWIKEKLHKSLQEWKTEQADKVNEALKDPAARIAMQASIATSEVPKAIAATLKPTDDELKASYRSLQVKQILLNGADVAGQTAKVEADLKSGASFETVIDRYSKDKPPAGKKLSEMDAPITRDQLQTEEYAPLKTLKEGDVSPPIITGLGTVIYKIVKVKNELPKDFDKNKDLLRNQLATTLGDAAFQKDLKELAKTISVSWKEQGWHALYDYYQLSTDFSLKPDEKRAKLKGIIDAAKAAPKSQPAELAFYASVTELKNESTGKPDPQLDDLRIEAIQAVSEYAPGSSLDLELADLYAAKKDGAGVGDALARASRENSDFSPIGEAMYVNIQTKVQANLALLSADAKKTIADAQLDWKNGEDQHKKDEAEQRAADAEAAKEQAIEKKKLDAEQKAEDAKKKAAAQIGPPAPKPAPAKKP